MPALSPARLAEVIVDAIEQSGEAGTLISAIRSHPRILSVTGSEGDLVIWVYAWTLTPGGRPQLANEYRIQMTSVSSPLELNPTGPTVLIGYEPNLKMFAGFDIARHKTFTTGSPSVQIDITSLRQALQHGLSFHRKVNDEIAVAIRPDQFLGYVRNASQLHLSGRSLPTVKVLKKVASLEAVSPQEIESLSKTRQRLIQAVSRLSRSANFREQVLRAYDHRCAVTRMQLRLVEAAHILPVAAPRSPDHVTNGIALSPTYHRAFDRGLIFLDDSYTMRVNPRKQDELSSLHLDGGLEAFIAPLGEISLPPDRQQWPKSQFINNANRFRGIPV